MEIKIELNELDNKSNRSGKGSDGICDSSTSPASATTAASSSAATSKSQFANNITTTKTNTFIFVFIIPCLLIAWYAAAIFFTPQAQTNVILRYFLWDRGQLIKNENGILSICPRSSICAEGIMQLMMIVIARITAFTSYVFMTFTFISKMHFLMRFLSSTYLRKYIPFESLHHIHVRIAKFYGALVIIHVISHYVRYILRRNVDLVEQLQSRVHVSGLIGVLCIFILILGMSPFIKRLKNRICNFEIRFNIHWIGMVILCIALCFHHPRLRLVTTVLLVLWALDYAYGLLFATYNLEIVEMIPLPNKAGVQILWHNPDGFRPKSGEYVKIQCPWLSKGGNEWHPFSIYLKESTELGYKNVHNIMEDGFATIPLVDEEEEGIIKLSLQEYIRKVLLECDHKSPENVLKESLQSRFVAEAREDVSKKNKTTQVFICPLGDWTKGLMDELSDQKQLRACWVRGPYTSPYFVAQNFSHLVLTATGIGITPALGVMGQYPGASRTKILVWTTREKELLKFFAPLMKDAHLAVIYYTGKDKLSTSEILTMSSFGNIYIQQSRPDSLSRTIGSTIVEFENHLQPDVALVEEVSCVEEIEMNKKAAWSVFYCGGSKRIEDELRDFSTCNGIGFQSELFDW